MPEAPLPTHCDVLVIGAGPAGSACAQTLARAGLDVLLVDQHHFPRDKVCGDGLIPDSHAALKRLGVFDEVASLAQPVQHVRCVGPRGGQVDVPGHLSVLPRKVLDHVLVRAAQRAGARLLTPLRFEAPLVEGERVVGARFRALDRAEGGSEGGTHEISARWVVLATGAVPQGLTAAGLCERHTPSGVALRGYVHCPAMVGQITQLQIVWHKRLRGGYGWIFPAPGGVFNIGAGLTGSHRVEQGKGRKRELNLRQMFDAFCEVHAPAGELMRQGTLQGEIKGAPLRCSLRGARWSRPGLLVAGEAAGTTYAFTGEGIGKAMESGMLAAEALLHERDAPDAAVQQRHEAALHALQPKFDLYDLASRVNEHPWLADLVIWRARRSSRILRRMTGVLEETQNPGRLFTVAGLRKLMFE
ncbi:MAG: NAD(P)/FAD-dependent oxidoreductase [Rubrivivax sp.]|nr:NAD(P)/FAD-dependent oxidoreductase [Rubrivivax sp.]